MPNLVGQTHEEALLLLQQSGITNYRIVYKESTEPQGTVISQSHLFGEKIVVNLTTVEIVISGKEENS